MKGIVPSLLSEKSTLSTLNKLLGKAHYQCLLGRENRAKGGLIMVDFTSVHGRVAIVTGATSGLGKAIARLYAQQGMKVVVAGRDEERGLAVVEEIRSSGGEASFFETEISAEEDVKSLVAFATDTYGRLDGIVNNAGIGGYMAPLHEVPMDLYDEVVGVNFKGVFLGIKYGAAAILRSKAQSGFIINIASGAGVYGTTGMCLYTGTKHAVIGLTKTAALDYAEHNITVNAICPGTMRTELTELCPPEMLEDLLSGIPVGRLAEPEEVAYMALFLASDLARYVTGASLLVDGGSAAGIMMPPAWSEPEILD
jgi:NAD(P)-dependent dehydrogenase (short-subunit alcohol dehydrogenase family)